MARVRETTPFEVQIKHVDRMRLTRINRGSGRVAYRRKQEVFTHYSVRRRNRRDLAQTILETRNRNEFVTYLYGISTYLNDYLEWCPPDEPSSPVPTDPFHGPPSASCPPSNPLDVSEKKTVERPVLSSDYWQEFRPFSYPLYQYVMTAEKELDLLVRVHDARPEVDGFDYSLDYDYQVYRWTGTEYEHWYTTSKDRYLEIFLAAVLHFHRFTQEGLDD